MNFEASSAFLVFPDKIQIHDGVLIGFLPREDLINTRRQTAYLKPPRSIREGGLMHIRTEASGIERIRQHSHSDLRCGLSASRDPSFQYGCVCAHDNFHGHTLGGSQTYAAIQHIAAADTNT